MLGKALRLLCAVAWMTAAAGPTHAHDKIRVVASFSILADLARNVAGDAADVSALVGPDSDAHAYAPSPADAKRLAEATLVLVNGLGFEGWIERLVSASGTKAMVTVASTGVTPRQMQDDGRSRADPHAWQSVANAKIYVSNIRDALVRADPEAKAIYAANAAAYTARLDVLEAEVKAAVAAIPPARRSIITTHDAFGYFAAAYGIAFIAPQGVSTEQEVSARALAQIIRQIKAEKIPAVFLENITDPRLMKRIAEETGAKIGGKLYSDALSAANGPAPTYLDLMRHNARELRSALLD